MLTIEYVFIFACFFFFNDTATTEIYTLSLHDALPIYRMVETAAAIAEGDLSRRVPDADPDTELGRLGAALNNMLTQIERSEEHTSELQSRQYLVCRLLLEKKKKISYLVLITTYYDIVN